MDVLLLVSSRLWVENEATSRERGKIYIASGEARVGFISAITNLTHI